MAPVIAKAQLTRTEWLQLLTRCCRFDPRKMFDATGKLKPITELDENEAAAIAGFQMRGKIEGKEESRKAVTIEIRFINRIEALTLIGKACHWYADRREETGGLDGGPIHKTIVVNFVKPAMSHEEAYRRMLLAPKPGYVGIAETWVNRPAVYEFP